MIKIVNGSRLDKIESTINDWLKRNDKISVISISSSYSGPVDGHVFTIHYSVVPVTPAKGFYQAAKKSSPKAAAKEPTRTKKDATNPKELHELPPDE